MMRQQGGYQYCNCDIKNEEYVFLINGLDH